MTASLHNEFAHTIPGINVSDSDTVAPIEREIRALANDLKAVKDEQEYIMVREQKHRNTAESTNSRVKWWSVLQAVVLVVVVAWQVYYLKVCFYIHSKVTVTDLCLSLSLK
jgi:p24 family protein beta-1